MPNKVHSQTSVQAKIYLSYLTYECVASQRGGGSGHIHEYIFVLTSHVTIYPKAFSVPKQYSYNINKYLHTPLQPSRASRQGYSFTEPLIPPLS